MPTATILELMKEHGQLLDSEISEYTKIPLKQVREVITELSAHGDISRCSITTFKDGNPVEGIQCRILGYVPPTARGRKRTK